MRAAITLVLVGLLASTGHADPFAVRNPVPAGSVEAAPAQADCGCEVLDPGKTRRHAGAWTALGGAGLVVGSLALTQYAAVKYDAAVERHENGDPTGRDDANHMRSIARWYGTGLFVTGAVAVGVGAYLYFSAPYKIRKERVAVVPAVSRDAVGFSVSGGF